MWDSFITYWVVTFELTQKFSLDINKNLTSKELVISRAIRFLIEQDLYWAFAYDRWVKSRAKYVPQFFAPVFPSLPRKIEAWLITTIYSTKIAKQAYAQGNNHIINNWLAYNYFSVRPLIFWFRSDTEIETQIGRFFWPLL